MHPIVTMNGICKSFGSFQALKNVDFTIYPGKVNVLIGENGAGKSTLMKILAGVHRKTAGSIFIEGTEVDIKNPIEAQKLGIGTVYQELVQVPGLSVAENMFLGSDLMTNRYGIVKWQEMYNKTVQITKELLGVEIDPREKVANLGIAHQQMIEIARVINRKSKILIMDEPTAALSSVEIRKLFETISFLKVKGIAIVYISHRLEELFEIGDYITVLRDGELVGAEQCCHINPDRLINMMVGRSITEMFPKADFSSIEKREMLHVKGLTRNGIFKDISFKINTGEIVGIAGLMGAGRTEIARAIFGADKLDSGCIYVKGKEIHIHNPYDAIKNGIALLPEDRKQQGLITIRTVVENMTIANLKRVCTKAGFIKKKKELNDSRNSIKRFRISVPDIQNKVTTLSGGNQQKVVISKWVYADSEILILDEPTRGIDVNAKTEVYNVINEFVKEGKAVIIISSDLIELLSVCDRLLIIREGRLVGEFDCPIDENTALTAMIGGRVNGS